MPSAISEQHILLRKKKIMIKNNLVFGFEKCSWHYDDIVKINNFRQFVPARLTQLHATFC